MSSHLSIVRKRRTAGSGSILCNSHPRLLEKEQLLLGYWDEARQKACVACAVQASEEATNLGRDGCELRKSGRREPLEDTKGHWEATQ